MSLCVAGSTSPSYLLSLYRISTSQSPSILLRSIAQPVRFLRRGNQTASQCCVYSERWRDKDWVACGLNSSSLGNQFYRRGFTCEVGKTMASGEETIYNIAVTDATGKDVPLSNYKGKVLLIVNVASQCGLTTTNYTELTELYQKFKDEGLEILAFPCNQFGAQEPGSIKEIQNFACTRFKAEYPIFSKVDVNGPTEAPLFKFLKSSKGGLFGDSIKWNFTKFLISKDGKVVERYGPTTPPLSIETDIKRQLAYAC